MLAHNLEQGEWSVRGMEVSVTVALSPVMIDVALGPEPKRVLQAAIAQATGKPLKFKMVSGGAQFAPKTAAPRPANGTSARGRAMADPMVQEMLEKFGGEIRSVIILKIAVERYVAMGGFNLQEMLSQAREQAEKLQEKMQQIVVDASSGGGSVTVKMNGQKHLLSVVIEPEVVKSGDIEMLQDLVIAAVNQAGQKVDEAMKSSLGGMFGGMGLTGV